MTRDSGLFLKEPPADPVPLYEAKYIHQFDHRFATTDGGAVITLSDSEKGECERIVIPKSFVDRSVLRERASKRGIDTDWLLGFRDISSGTNERTAIASVFPFSAVGNTINLILGLNSTQAACFAANVNSFVFDYCCRQKVGGTHVNIWIFKQLPTIPLERFSGVSPWAGPATLEKTFQEFLLPRVLELTCTARDLEPFAQDCGYDGPPFRWDEERRFQLRAELDAAFFHLYLPSDANGDWLPAAKESPEDLARLKESFPQPRDAVSYIMDTFPIVRRKDIAKHGNYRTKDTILETYDAMQTAIRTGLPYQTPLNPPPADPRVAHPPRAT